MPPNPCRVLLKEKESHLNVVQWLTCGRFFLTFTQLKWRPPWDIVCPCRLALIFLRSIHRVSILAIVQVKSDSSQTNQILQLPWKQEIALLIASHSPLPLPPTNHMQTYGCYCWFIYHLLKKIKYLTSSQTVLATTKLLVPKLLGKTIENSNLFFHDTKGRIYLINDWYNSLQRYGGEPFHVTKRGPALWYGTETHSKRK